MPVCMVHDMLSWSKLCIISMSSHKGRVLTSQWQRSVIFPQLSGKEVLQASHSSNELFLIGGMLHTPLCTQRAVKVILGGYAWGIQSGYSTYLHQLLEAISVDNTITLHPPRGPLQSVQGWILHQKTSSAVQNETIWPNRHCHSFA